MESILDGKKNGLEGSVFLEDRVLRPTDKQLIKYNISRLKDLKEKVEKVKTTLKEEHNYLFTKSGKVKSGEESAQKFNEECLGSIINVTKKINDSKENLNHFARSIRRCTLQQKIPLFPKKEKRSKIVTELKSEV